MVSAGEALISLLPKNSHYEIYENLVGGRLLSYEHKFHKDPSFR